VQVLADKSKSGEVGSFSLVRIDVVRPRLPSPTPSLWIPCADCFAGSVSKWDFTGALSGIPLCKWDCTGALSGIPCGLSPERLFLEQVLGVRPADLACGDNTVHFTGEVRARLRRQRAPSHATGQLPCNGNSRLPFALPAIGESKSPLWERLGKGPAIQTCPRDFHSHMFETIASVGAD
jgi:hypothetical protein